MLVANDSDWVVASLSSCNLQLGTQEVHAAVRIYSYCTAGAPRLSDTVHYYCTVYSSSINSTKFEIMNFQSDTRVYALVVHPMYGTHTYEYLAASQDEYEYYCCSNVTRGHRTAPPPIHTQALFQSLSQSQI